MPVRNLIFLVCLKFGSKIKLICYSSNLAKFFQLSFFITAKDTTCRTPICVLVGCAESVKDFTEECFAGFLIGQYREEEDQQPHLQFHHQDKTVHFECEFSIHRSLMIMNVYEYYLSN